MLTKLQLVRAQALASLEKSCSRSKFGGLLRQCWQPASGRLGKPAAGAWATSHFIASPSERTGAPASKVFCKSSMKSPLVTLFGAVLSSGVCLKVAVRHSLRRTLDAFALAIRSAIRHRGPTQVLLIVALWDHGCRIPRSGDLPPPPGIHGYAASETEQDVSLPCASQSLP